MSNYSADKNPYKRYLSASPSMRGHGKAVGWHEGYLAAEKDLAFTAEEKMMFRHLWSVREAVVIAAEYPILESLKKKVLGEK